MRPDEPAHFLPGEIVAGKYRVGRLLGRGGMGVVVEATHLELNEPVALKFLRTSSPRPDAVERLLREARACAQIRSEHVARILDVGRLDGGAPFLVLELMRGRDLGAVLAQRGPIPAEEAVGWALQVCEGLAEAHALGIVHRDIKPSNLFLVVRRGGVEQIKILDFGIAKEHNRAPQQGITTTSQVIGSPQYMSPEQMRDARDVDARADVWSLGVVLYQLLCGEVPFQAPTTHALCAAILVDAPRPLAERGPNLPAPLVSAVMRCLEKNPDQRFRSVADLAAALGPFGGPRAPEVVARVEAILADVGSPPGATPSVLRQTQDTIDPLSFPRLPRAARSPQDAAPRRWAPWLAAAVAFAAGAGWLLRGHPAPSGSGGAGLPSRSPPSSSEIPAAPAAPVASAPSAPTAPSAPGVQPAPPSSVPRASLPPVAAIKRPPPALSSAPVPVVSPPVASRDRTVDTRH